MGALVLLAALSVWPPPTSSAPIQWVLIGGVASAFAYYGLFRAFEGGPISVTSPVVASWAVVSALLGITLFDEAFLPLRALGGALVVIGVVAVAARNPEGSASTWREPRPRVLGWAFTSCLGFGVMVAALRPLGDALGPVASILVLWGVQWIVLLPWAVRKFEKRWIPSCDLWPILVGLGILETVGFLAVDLGLMVAPMSIVAPAASLGSLLTVLVGKHWLGESVDGHHLGFAMVVVAGIVMLGFS